MTNLQTPLGLTDGGGLEWVLVREVYPHLPDSALIGSCKYTREKGTEHMCVGTRRLQYQNEAMVNCQNLVLLAVAGTED